MAFTITDSSSYVTAQFTVEDESGRECFVSLAEHDWYDDWQIRDEDGELITDNPELIDELIFICQKRLEEGING